MSIWKMKSVSTESPATRQKDYRAGMLVCIPIKKARASQRDATIIDGPISYIAKAILSF